VTSLDDGVRLSRRVPTQGHAFEARRLVLGDVRVSRTGPADPLSRDDWLMREEWNDHRAHLAARPPG
jgi:hypothetical protein